MPNLHWTMPVARWSFWSATSPTAPDISFIDPMVRRRLSSLSRMALKVAHDCAAGRDAVRMVFASRHGELRRTTDILHAIAASEPVSPNAFSLSVLNAMSGMFGIARGDRSAASAISAGAETLGYALLEAHAQYTDAPSAPVLVVYADEPADPLYGPVNDEVEGGALAILLDATSPQCELSCSVAHNEPAGARSFATQAAALAHCLDNRGQSSWQSNGNAWHWRWHGDAA
ncbi:beta-ketoacyl synthase chain length factor [Paraburkholderia phosphatilytica]|uniref:beta-ketoacyl synthase chain length factor n=1 Tax=Paraburkholderia phosphatilytica TaxID=2282883 RepID=UPI000E4C4D64|nr:beta-ketoacyl synthase chain length factor [Paraburkholderia phosphatilytica]